MSAPQHSRAPWIVTGAAGFIGAALCRRLLDEGQAVVGLDNLSDYYDPALKRARLARLQDSRFRFVHQDLCDRAAAAELVTGARPPVVVHLAAQPGVRASLVDPARSLECNVVGFLSVLEACRQAEVGHLVYASSSSVYGDNSATPFSVDDPAGHPVSVYAATKRADELLAHTYSHVYAMPTTGLRFFTVYGPWGRPDMAYYRFAEAILDGAPVRVFGDGSALRDFTYVDDIVEGIVRVCHAPPAGDAAWSPRAPAQGRSRAPWRLFNIGHGEQATVNELLERLAGLLGRPLYRRTEAAQPGDVGVTHADVTGLADAVGFVPATPLDVGLKYFAEWFTEYRRGRA